MKKQVLTLCGTYTLDPIAEVAEYWFDFLGIDASLRIAPYAQLFQQMLDPASVLRRNSAGANVVMLRWTDLIAHRAEAATTRIAWPDVEARVDEVASALRSFSHDLPCLVLVGPPDHADAVLERATRELIVRLAGTPNLFVEPGERAMTRYDVAQVHDPASDRFGHVPFTPSALAALGTTVARWYAALVRAPIKLVAVDGDHTLWSGVVAEDGVDGVRIDAAHAALQRALLQQNECGRLLCLLSKNAEADVRGVFQNHPQMPLRWSDLVARRVDWNDKSDNLQRIVAELGFGLDSAAFLDDSPIECAQMRARCPAVTTVRVPTDAARLAAFTDHLWLLDRAQVTAEDRSRATMYRDDASRAELRRGTGSLQAFLDGLELDVEITPPAPTDLPRLAQLSQRTNQFNASLIRCTDSELRRDAARPGMFQRLVRARDRFGDYGIVGQLRAHVVDGRLEVDLFMLSCRALGRGIEHRMLAAAGNHALAQGLREVCVLFCRGERNAPVGRFLQQVCGSSTAVDRQWFGLSAQQAADSTFDAAGTDAGDALDRVPAAPVEARSEHADLGACYERIAHTLTTGARIQQAMAERVRPRPDLAAGFVAPGTGHEHAIASIWQEVLRIDGIGAHDRFQDLGGRSVQLVQVHRLLRERLQVELDISTLFQHATVASLAAHLSTHVDGTHADGAAAAGAAQQRGIKMREARARAGRRFGVSA